MNHCIPEVIILAAVQTAHSKELPESSMSLEQFLNWQEEDIHAEWINGKVIYMSPVSRKHQELSRFLTHLIGIFSENLHSGVLLTAPFSMHLDQIPAVREPDLLFVLAKNRNRLKETYLDGPADLVVEIISPESIGRDRGDKFAEYEQAGIPEYWLIDPIRERAEFYNLENGRYHLSEINEGIFHSTILPGFYLHVNYLWQDPLPSVVDILKKLKAL